jgi:hypothetical protein
VTSLLLALSVIGIGLGVLLYVGSLFFQGYIYTEPSTGLAWQAPAAAAALFLFLLFWCVIVANSATASPSQVPYDSLFRFSPTIEMVKEPIPEMTAVYKKGDAVTYFLNKEPGARYYLNKKLWDLDRKEQRWLPTGVKEIKLKHDGTEMVFELVEGGGEGANREFVNKATGFTIVERSGAGGADPSPIPVAFRWSRFLVNLFLNFFHLALWFVCLWLLLRYQWGHALGLALVAWLLMTIVILPMLLDSAAQVAEASRTPQGTKKAWLEPKGDQNENGGCGLFPFL